MGAVVVLDEAGPAPLDLIVGVGTCGEVARRRQALRHQSVDERFLRGEDAGDQPRDVEAPGGVALDDGELDAIAEKLPVPAQHLVELGKARRDDQGVAVRSQEPGAMPAARRDDGERRSGPIEGEVARRGRRDGEDGVRPLGASTAPDRPLDAQPTNGTVTGAGGGAVFGAARALPRPDATAERAEGARKAHFDGHHFPSRQHARAWRAAWGFDNRRKGSRPFAGFQPVGAIGAQLFECHRLVAAVILRRPEHRQQVCGRTKPLLAEIGCG